MKISKAIITAAGFGSRFLPFVKNIPKEMLPVLDKPSIHYLTQECEEAGIEQIIIVVREEHSLIEDYFYKPAENVRELLAMQGKLDRFVEVEKVLAMNNIQFVRQDPSLPYGNGSPVLSARHLINPDESFVLLFGDDMVLTKEKGAVKQLIEFYEQHPCDALMAVQKVPQSEVNRYAMVKAKEEDKGDTFGVVDYLIEKPDISQAPSDLASYGRMILPYKIFDYLKAEAIGKDNELWLQDANAKLAKESKFMYKVVDGEWMTTGDPTRYLGVQLKYYLASSKYHDSAAELIKSFCQE
jgi:UTP--glucose-1-phosphate uridylyltransferase